MPLPLQLILLGTALSAIPALGTLFQAFRIPTADASGSRSPFSGLTLDEQRAALGELPLRKFEFEVDQIADRARRDEERREQERRDRADAFRLAEAQRAEDRRFQLQRDADLFDREVQLLNERARREDVQFRSEINLKTEAIRLDALIKAQDVQRREFEVFSRSLLPGSQPFIRADGSFGSIPIGSLLGPADVAAGATPLPFQPSPPTASRVFQVPGVFVGPTFQFKTIRDATEFLAETAIFGRTGKTRPRAGVSGAR